MPDPGVEPLTESPYPDEWDRIMHTLEHADDATIERARQDVHGKDVSMTRRLIITVEPDSFLIDKTDDPMAVADYMLTAAGEYSIDGRLIDARWDDPSNE